MALNELFIYRHHGTRSVSKRCLSAMSVSVRPVSLTPSGQASRCASSATISLSVVSTERRRGALEKTWSLAPYVVPGAPPQMAAMMPASQWKSGALPAHRKLSTGTGLHAACMPPEPNLRRSHSSMSLLRVCEVST